MDIRRFGSNPSTSSNPADASAPAKKSFFQLSRSEQIDAVRPALVKTLGFGIPVVSTAAALLSGYSGLESLGVLAIGTVAGAAAAGFTHLVMGGEISVIG